MSVKLGDDQKAFIRTKVKSLGSEEKVKALYNTDSKVDQYARVLANTLFGKRRMRRTR